MTSEISKRSMSLWEIDNTIDQLITLREEVETDEERTTIDAEIEAWVGRELKKFTNCYGYIRREEQQAEMAKEVAKQAIMWQHRHEGRAVRVRDMVKRVMELRDLSKVEGPGMGSFAIKGNGGMRRLDILDERLIPATCRSVDVHMSQSEWEAVQVLIEGSPVLLRKLLAGAKAGIDNKELRAALEAGEDVPGARLAERGTNLTVR